MHNPLALLSSLLLDALIKSGHQYFVRQSYVRGIDPLDVNSKEVLLLTPYREFTEVNAHFQAIKFDKRKYVYQIDQTGEKERLYLAAQQPEGYKIFIALLQERIWEPAASLLPKIKNYLRVYTKWKPEKGENVQVGLYIQFGELYLHLRSGSEEMKVPLSAIETL